MPKRSGYTVPFTEDRESLAEVMEDALELSREFHGSDVAVWFADGAYYSTIESNPKPRQLAEDARESGAELICVLRIPKLKGWVANESD